MHEFSWHSKPSLNRSRQLERSNVLFLFQWVMMPPLYLIYMLYCIYCFWRKRRREVGGTASL